MKKQFDRMMQKIDSADIATWSDIDTFIEDLEKTSPPQEKISSEEFHALLSSGIGFITYDFGIDGVSIEIFKYAQALEGILNSPEKKLPLHFIGGEFYDKADVVLKPYWNRFTIPDMNGWSKWCDGKWFSKLYYEPMPEGSETSSEVAVEIWKQASSFARTLGSYMSEKDIHMLIPVNIPSNPGNFAIMLALTMVTEAMGTYVLSSNHDYYWEGGKPASEKSPDEEPGPRDHFFKNMENEPFFSLFKKMYPWNGKRWIQVNINTPQTDALVERFGFDRNRVFELGTAISDEFFEVFNYEDTKLARKKMAYVLSDGKPTIDAVPIRKHIASLNDWMTNQHPLACSFSEGITLDSTTDKTIYCLQPTRVIGRKRIAMDFQMLKALMHHSRFRDVFENDTEYQLVVHITGPVPIEHQEDLETVLNAYVDLCESLPKAMADRIFIAFSVGTENHPALKENGLEPLCIEQIYRLATVVLFPSETEGRGLPIVESSAGGVPIICSRYYPEEVFAEVVGEGLNDEEQIKYLLFPEGEYSEEFLNSATDLMLSPQKTQEIKQHNKQAVRLRYSSEMIHRKFEHCFDVLRRA